MASYRHVVVVAHMSTQVPGILGFHEIQIFTAWKDLYFMDFELCELALFTLFTQLCEERSSHSSHSYVKSASLHSCVKSASLHNSN